jgi:peroxiredoxin
MATVTANYLSGFHVQSDKLKNVFINDPENVFMLFRILVFIFSIQISSGNLLAQEAEMSIPTRAEDVKPLKSGDKVPTIYLKDDNGKLVNVNLTLKQKPAVLIFYRGGWCPYCNMQMSSLRAVEQEFYNLGFNIFGISPDKPSKLAESRGKHNFKYELLSDSLMTVTKAFGLAYKVPDDMVNSMKTSYGVDLEGDSGEKHHLLPVPAVYLVDEHGVFGFQYVNPDYTVRMDSQELLKIARKKMGK